MFPHIFLRTYVLGVYNKYYPKLSIFIHIIQAVELTLPTQFRVLHNCEVVCPPQTDPHAVFSRGWACPPKTLLLLRSSME